MLRGRNFPGHLLPGYQKGEEQKAGFFTTRWVQALTPKRAELKAVAHVWNDKMLDDLEFPENEEDRAMLTVESIDKVRKMPKMRGGGATWFVEEDEE